MVLKRKLAVGAIALMTALAPAALMPATQAFADATQNDVFFPGNPRENRHEPERLGEASGVSQSHISEMEAGNTVPTVFVAKRQARALGVSVDELIAEEEW